MMKLRTDKISSSEFEFLQPRTINQFLIQNKKIDPENDLHLNILLDNISSNLDIIKNQIK